MQKDIEKAKQENREYTPPARSYSTEFTKQFLPGPDPSIPDTEDMERLNGSLMLPEIEEIMPDINAPFSGKISRKKCSEIAFINQELLFLRQNTV